MCAEPIADEHQHVVNVAARQLMCTCRGCYLLFTDPHAKLRYRAVPDRYLTFSDFTLDRRAWEALQIPVGLAFFFHNSDMDKTVAFYPGPAGATESELDLDAWSSISGADSRLGMLADDVEALLVRVPDRDHADPELNAPAECYLVPIDACYEFVGRLRMLWRGFDGGYEVREFVDEFFERIKARSKVAAHERPGVSNLTFTVVDVAAEQFSVTPRLIARIGITAGDDEPIQAIALRCQIRIEPLRRPYSDEEAAGLVDLFGPRERWVNTQRTFLWQHSTAMVQGFSGGTEISLPLECTYDFEVAASKYLHALRDGAVPLLFLFSGTVFVQGDRGFSVRQVSWECEAQHEMPVAVWKDLVRIHYPNAGWVRLGHDTVSALAAYKSSRGMLDFEDAVTTLLAEAPQVAQPTPAPEEVR